MTPGRNDRCSCGSGRKYKRCCGAVRPTVAAPVARAAAGAPAANNLGLTHLRARRLGEAVGCFEHAVALDPNFAIGHYNLGTALQQQGRDGPAIAALRRAVALAPKLADAHERLGNLLLLYGGVAEAVDCFRRAAAAAPGSTLGRLNRARVLHHERKLAEAESCLRRAIALDPANAAIHYFLGLILGETGRFEEAVASLQHSIALDPNQAYAYQSLIRSKKVGAGDRPLVERMLALLDGDTVAGGDRADLHFALGKAFDDLAEYDRAIHHYDAGNRLARRGVPFDRTQLAVGVNRLIASFTPEFFTAHRGLGSDCEAPVLILGMMRSGTTLVEQILSSHSAVAAGGELGFWHERAAAYAGAGAEGRTPAYIGRLADDYRSTLQEKGPQAARITDKMPENFLWIGLIHLAFPRACIIHCRRHPVDTCLSIYFTNFQAAQNFAYDRGDLVFYYQQYARLMSHWRRVLPPDRFIEVDYEDLIADREAATRRLVAAIGLDWEAACLRPERNPRAIGTASLWQVRQPVYTSSVARWRRYEPWLGELRRLLPKGGAGADAAAEPPPAAAARQAAARLRQDGRVADAVSLLQRALPLAPTDPALHGDLGLLLLSGHRVSEAADSLERAVALDPDCAVRHYHFAIALERQRRRGEAVAAYRRSIALDPSLAAACDRLGDLLHALGDRAEALACFADAARVAPDSTIGRLARAKSLLVGEQPFEAEAILRGLTACDPPSSEACRLLGNLLRERGEFDAAADCLERAIALDPELVSAYHDLVHCRRATEAQRPLLARMATLADGDGRTDHERALLHFALGKGLDDLGLYDQAIRRFDAGNRLEHSGLSFDRAQFAGRIDRLIGQFDTGFFAANAGLGTDCAVPVMIVGMPRSGTTLVEQILSSHPEVGAAGELTFWSERDDRSAVGTEIAGTEISEPGALADQYRSLLARLAPNAVRVTDKNPFNFLHLGLIHLLFPNAFVIHCRRSPIDTCLSIYFTRFATRQDFAYDRSDLVFYWRQYVRLMAHWRRVLPPDRLIEVDYEELIADRETATRRLISFVGLGWDDSCLRPENNPRVVRTASSWQARQPVYDTSVGRWRHYEPWLGGLRALLPAPGSP